MSLNKKLIIVAKLLPLSERNMPNFLKLEGNYLGFFVLIAVIVGVISLLSYAGIAESNSERRIDQKAVVIDQFSRNIIVDGKTQVVNFKITTIPGTDTYKVTHE